MKATLDDLRGALHDEADAAAYPDVDALVAGARRRLAASRRRRLAVLGAVTAAVVVVGGLAITRPTHQSLPRPAVSPTAGLGPFSVINGNDFPEYERGMKRLMVVDAPMLEQVNGSISVPTTPGRGLTVRMSCTPKHNADKMKEWGDRMRAKFTALGRTVDLLCDLGGDDLIGVATSAKSTVLADVFIDHKPSPGLPSLFEDAKIQVAVYETVPWQDYPFPPRPADMDTNAQYAWSSFSLPGTPRVLGPTTRQEANRPLTFTQPSDPNLSLNLQVRGPGRMRVLVNGKDITELVGSPLTQDKFFAFWGYTSTGINFPLDPDSATKPGTPVTVTIEPQGFQGPDWRIAVQSAPTGG